MTNTEQFEYEAATHDLREEIERLKADAIQHRAETDVLTANASDLRAEGMQAAQEIADATIDTHPFYPGVDNYRRGWNSCRVATVQAIGNAMNEAAKEQP